MICILKFELGKITGWIIASDPHDARRQAGYTDAYELRSDLCRMEFTPRPGKYIIGEGHPPRALTEFEEVTNGYLMLVS